MNTYLFNACLAAGWLLVLIGGVLINPGAGLAVAGVLLIVLALTATHLAGGLYLPEYTKPAAKPAEPGA